jgi:hypothetical protein
MKFFIWIAVIHNIRNNPKLTMKIHIFLKWPLFENPGDAYVLSAGDKQNKSI